MRDLGNDNELLLDLTRRIDSGELPGPRIVRAGLVEGRSAYSARIGRIPETLPKAFDIVRWYSDHGYRQMKIYNSFNPDWVAPVAQEAHRLGMRVSGHVPAFMSPDRAIRYGYDEINRLNQLPLLVSLFFGIDSADLTDIQPAEYRADLVVLLLNDEPVFGIVVEVQLSSDEDKRYMWPVYVVKLRARLRCPWERPGCFQIGADCHDGTNG